MLSQFRDGEIGTVVGRALHREKVQRVIARAGSRRFGHSLRPLDLLEVSGAEVGE